MEETKKKENCQVWYLKHVREIHSSIPSPLFRRGFPRKTVSNGSKTRKRRKNGRIEKLLGQRRLNKSGADRENTRVKGKYARRVVQERKSPFLCIDPFAN